MLALCKPNLRVRLFFDWNDVVGAHEMPSHVQLRLELFGAQWAFGDGVGLVDQTDVLSQIGQI